LKSRSPLILTINGDIQTYYIYIYIILSFSLSETKLKIKKKKDFFLKKIIFKCNSKRRFFLPKIERKFTEPVNVLSLRLNSKQIMSNFKRFKAVFGSIIVKTKNKKKNYRDNLQCHINKIR
jgi:hypothetical protein